MSGSVTHINVCCQSNFRGKGKRTSEYSSWESEVVENNLIAIEKQQLHCEYNQLQSLA
jgi:hypothetical protein